MIKKKMVSIIPSPKAKHHVGVSINGGTPQIHPFIDGIFPSQPPSHSKLRPGSPEAPGRCAKTLGCPKKKSTWPYYPVECTCKWWEQLWKILSPTKLVLCFLVEWALDNHNEHRPISVLNQLLQPVGLACSSMVWPSHAMKLPTWGDFWPVPTDWRPRNQKKHKQHIFTQRNGAAEPRQWRV